MLALTYAYLWTQLRGGETP